MKHLAIALGALLVAFWAIGGAKAQTQVQPYYGSPPTVSGGPVNKIPVDTTHGLPVNCILGCSGGGGGGLSVQDGATFSAGASNFTPGGGEYNSSPTALTSGTQGTFSLNQYRALNVDTPTTNNNLYTALTAASPALPATTATTNTYTNGVASPINMDLNGGIYTDCGQFCLTLGPAAVASALPFVFSSQYPVNAVTTTPTAVTASTTGTTAATAASLAATASVTNYVCGFSITADATALAVGTATLSGTISGSLSYLQNILAATAGVGILQQNFNPCVPASAANTAITITSAAAGTGGNTIVNIWGYRL